jgi:hypothetical protein
MFPAFQNVFSFKKKTFWMIQIVFGTIRITVRAEQKVISASLVGRCRLEYTGTDRKRIDPMRILKNAACSTYQHPQI